MIARRTLSRLYPLIFSSVVATCVQAPPAFASDVGPPAAVAAIRHDLPLLLAAPLEYTRLKPTIDWVVADREHAVAMWHAAKNKGIVALHLRSNQWWWRGAAVTTGGPADWTYMSIPGNEVTDCDAPFGPPTAHGLFSEGFIDATLAGMLSSRLKQIGSGGSRAIHMIKLCAPNEQYVKSGKDPYAATFFYKEEYYYDWWFVLSGWAPVDSHRAMTANAKPYHFVTLKADPRRPDYRPRSQPTPLPTTLTFARGATFEVWFPYVLSRTTHYTLNLSGGTSIHALSGKLKNNVLHFDLPAFSWEVSGPVYGEIDGTQMDNVERP